MESLWLSRGWNEDPSRLVLLPFLEEEENQIHFLSFPFQNLFSTCIISSVCTGSAAQRAARLPQNSCIVRVRIPGFSYLYSSSSAYRHIPAQFFSFATTCPSHFHHSPAQGQRIIPPVFTRGDVSSNRRGGTRDQESRVGIVFAHGRQNICKKKEVSGYPWIPWAKGFSGSRPLGLFIALLGHFSSQQACDTRFGNSCDLRLSIITIIHYVLCSQLFFLSFPHSFTSTSLHQGPHKILIAVGLYLLSVGSDIPRLSQTMATSSGGSPPCYISALHKLGNTMEKWLNNTAVSGTEMQTDKETMQSQHIGSPLRAIEPVGVV